MKIEFLTGSLVPLAIFVFLAVKFLKNYHNDRARFVLRPVLLIGAVQLIISVFSFLWSFDILQYSQNDFLFIYALIILVQGFLIFLVVYNISGRNKNLFYLLGFFLGVFLLIIFLNISFSLMFIPAYFLLVLLLSISLLFREDDYKDIGIFGVFYSGFSLLLHAFVLIGLVEVYFSSIIYNLLLFVFQIFLVKYLLENPVHPKPVPQKKSYLFIFLRNFVFMIALINLVFIGTIVIHEFGHLAASQFYNCSTREIVYQSGFPETRILCTDIGSSLYVSLGGPFLPLLLGGILIFVGGRFLKEIGMLMIGFDFIVSSQDLLEIGLSQNIALFVVITGILIGVTGIILLAKSKTEDYIYSIGQFG